MPGIHSLLLIYYFDHAFSLNYEASVALGASHALHLVECVLLCFSMFQTLYRLERKTARYAGEIEYLSKEQHLSDVMMSVQSHQKREKVLFF